MLMIFFVFAQSIDSFGSRNS